MTRKFFLFPLALLVLGLILAIGCCDKKPVYEHSGVGTVRSVDWYYHGFTFETDDGQLRTFNVCKRVGMPVWEGLRGDVEFRWMEWSNMEAAYQYSECYEVRAIRRVK